MKSPTTVIEISRSVVVELLHEISDGDERRFIAIHSHQQEYVAHVNSRLESPSLFYSSEVLYAE